ncbi:hypothetical protein [Spirillospora sp. NPDC047279]|uniref:hypothetical protein n=1 Tax=Spirillospora sp. NPDC047279 TaxID=3155478 RepID=UPI0033E6EBD5
MRLRLTGGVVAEAGLGAWFRRTSASGPVRVTDEGGAAPGTAVALGPEDAADETVRRALADLAALVRAGGALAAGAGVDLGDGFRSARLDGARGDQRDAVLAALRVVDAGRLGPRAGVLVALFGPDATKRVGAAATRAITEGRWPALHLASAASDLLGPEQLERVLALEEPDGADLIPGGLPSVLGDNLRQVLEPLPRPRRLELLLDLWARASEHAATRLAGRACRERRLAGQSRNGRVDDLRARRQEFEDQQILWQARYALNDMDPSPAALARWTAPDHYWYLVLNRLMHDAFAATALVRTATAIADHGMAEGLARSGAVVAAAASQFADEHVETRKSAGLPARPIRYVRDLHREMGRREPGDDRLARYAQQRLARARDYAVVTAEEIRKVLDQELHVPHDVLTEWAGFTLWPWREKIGFVRPPESWGDPWNHRLPGEGPPLSERVEADPVIAEVVGDFLWYADLLDALAVLHGHEAAEIRAGYPWYDYDPPEPGPEPEPLTPRLDSITLAVSGAAQLVALGGPVQGARTWDDYVTGLRAGTAIAEALSGEFDVPPPLAAVDGTLVPGTGARFRPARTARTLAAWSDYMGNCIASPHYVEWATKGQVVLSALHDKDDRVLVNAELVPTRTGWRVREIAARFNDTPDETLDKRFRRWVATLPGRAPDPLAEPPADPEPPARRGPVRPQLVHSVGPRLGKLAEEAWAGQVTPAVLGTLAALAGTEPDAALTRLRRMEPAQLKAACRRADPVDLWTATAVRPLDAVVREHFADQLDLLLDGGPLPRGYRRLVRLIPVAPAYSLGLMARRIRAAMGDLACEDALTVTHRTPAPMLCALIVAVTCRAPGIALTPIAPPRAVEIPGFPASTLSDEDGPWQRAFAEARELGADTDVFWERIAADGLRAPARWLAQAGWPALWSSANSPAVRGS